MCGTHLSNAHRTASLTGTHSGFEDRIQTLGACQQVGPLFRGEGFVSGGQVQRQFVEAFVAGGNGGRNIFGKGEPEGALGPGDPVDPGVPAILI